MESSTFLSVVNDILDNFDDICESINYIQKIDNMLSRISIQEEKENESKIQSIFDFIKEELTSAQVKKLHSQLKTYRDYPECKFFPEQSVGKDSKISQSGKMMMIHSMMLWIKLGIILRSSNNNQSVC
jgi:hypothetical protein